MEIYQKVIKPRQSNMELLRIMAMFLVLIVHSDYLSLGEPTRLELISAPEATLTRIFIEAFSLICVNLFVFISGWFGIKPRRHKFVDLLFQVFYYLTIAFIIAMLTGQVNKDWPSLKEIFVLGNWFIPAYLMLFLLAPAFNDFVENTGRKRLRTILIVFFAVQTLCGWLGKANFFASGYSVISFTGIYLLARYIRKYDIGDNYSPSKLSAIFAGCVFINAGLGFINVYSGIYFLSMSPYLNPFTIVATVSLALLFTKFSFQSSVVNFLAQSAFSVYLLHINFNLIDLFMQINQDIFHNYNGIEVIVLIFFTCCCWFLAAVILDQPRKWIWRNIQNRRRGIR